MIMHANLIRVFFNNFAMKVSTGPHGSYHSICYCIHVAELVRAEKEHSDWLPEPSKFSYIRTAKMDRLRYNIPLDG